MIETEDNKDNEGNSGEEFLFHQLIAMFQALALQQLGKLMNPITGKVERDLQQAKITIDMISMIQQKTEGNLSSREKGMIDNILLELRMNYVDESNRPDDEEGAESEEDNSKAEKEDKSSDKGDQPSEKEQAEDKKEDQ